MYEMFGVDPEFATQLEWVESFVRDEVEPVDLVVGHAWNMADPVRQALIPPLQAQVRERGLWATHLPPELGGAGFGQLKLALLNEILGRTHSGPIVFGCQAPDSGNAEILARYGTPELKQRFLEPLLDNRVVSAFSMTEPQGGSDPTEFVTSAERDGDEWVINGEKWFSGHANFADFLIVLAVTDPDESRHRRMSMFVVPADAPGVEIIRNIGLHGHTPEQAAHPYVRYTDVRVPAGNILGGQGDGFLVAQTRLGGGRIHHAMRVVGLVRKALDMMCERALSRHTRGETLARKQMVQEMIADSWIELEQFRLLVLQTAWKIDRHDDYQRVRGDISAVKAAMPRVLNSVASRAVQVHGSLGVTDELPLMDMVSESFRMGLADGATEVHKITLAREVLKAHSPTSGMFPSQHLPALRVQAEEKFRPVLVGMNTQRIAPQRA